MDAATPSAKFMSLECVLMPVITKKMSGKRQRAVELASSYSQWQAENDRNPTPELSAILKETREVLDAINQWLKCYEGTPKENDTHATGPIIKTW
jgi:hypothetical protein